MSREERDRVQPRFTEEKEVVVVGTIAFGMGIDRADVRYVLHAEPPSTMEGYYQEIGRAGRDGEASDAHLFYETKAVGRPKRQVEASDNVTDERKAALRAKAESIVAFLETPSCRRATLLRYFGEDQAGTCGRCDRCLKPVKARDGRAQAKIVIEATLETDKKYSVSTLSEILSPHGVMPRGEADLRAFGAGTSLSQTTWKSIIRQMMGAGYLEIHPERFGAISVTRTGRQILFREDPVPLAGSWVAIQPKIEEMSFVSAGAGRRNQLPPDLHAAFDDLRNMFHRELEEGLVKEVELVRLLEARPSDRYELRAITQNLAVTERAEDVVSRWAANTEPSAEFTGFSLDL